MGGAVVNQPMPQYLPPATIGGGSMTAAAGQPALIDRTTAAPVGTQSNVVSQDLPALQPSSVTSTQAMPAQTAAVSAPASSPTLPAQTASPQLGVVQGETYTHTIASGESLYTIARRYDVSAADIIAANNIGSPDRITVGQRLVIPGRADLLAQRASAPQQVAAAPGSQTLTTPSGAPATQTSTQTQAAATPATTTAPTPAPVEQPTQTAAAPAQEPVASATPAPTSDKFRWPISGRVITDFAASRGTGINIEAPEGTSVRAAENGEVIYVGNAVEGYGNLVLIKHANGYVSAYAHLNTIGVVRGDTVSRGDAIGTVGMTGSVNRPQLHFELRKGATPVDPMPLLAG